MVKYEKWIITRKDTQGAFRKPMSIYVTDVIYLEKYSGPKVQCRNLVHW